MKINTVATDSFEMEYFTFGDGGRPFVILPGLSIRSVMLFSDAIARQYAAFAKDHTVYVFDRRRELPSSYPVRAMAEDTAAAMDSLGLRNAHIFGASQGGMMALCIAAYHPEAVRRTVLGSAAARVSEERYRVLEQWIGMAKNKDREGLYLAFGEKLYPPEVFRQNKEALVSAAADVTDDELERFVILAEGTRGFDITGDIGRIRCPVMAIGSRDDAVLGPEASPEIAGLLRGHDGLRLYMYSGYGHAAFDTAPDYQDRILSFFTE